MAKTYWIMDYETITNCFVAVYEPINSENRKVFVIHKLQNDFDELLGFLHDNMDTKDWHLGFNNLDFDSQITEYLLKYQTSLRKLEAHEIANKIYKYAQKIISRKREERLEFPENKLKIPALDIYRFNNWDSNAKRSSLKWIQGSLRWNNVQEMPHQHNAPVDDMATLIEVIDYCINDVGSTKAIFNHKNAYGEKEMHQQIALRAELSESYDLKLHSAAEPRISKEMFLHFLSEKLGRPKRDIRNARTSRNYIQMDALLLPYIKFETAEFKAMHTWMQGLSVTIDEAKLLRGDAKTKQDKGPQYAMNFKGVKTVFALGGLHGCIAPGVYKAGGGKIIVSADVTSFYPNLAIRNKWSPAHIPKAVFCDLYEWFFEERKKHKKGSSLNYLFKIILNATYGLSKNIHSFLYDPEFTYRITLNGQLTLAMLYEMVILRIPNALPLMQNTDGLEFLIDEEHYDTFMEICKEWETMTNLELETLLYEKMIIRDVNNYIAVDTKGKIKYKGAFEYKEMALHKNHSALIVPKAWDAYFLKGISPKNFLKANRDIHDYCIMSKLKGVWKFKQIGVFNGTLVEEKLQKLLRYYVSERGHKFLKYHPDGRELQLVSDKWMLTLFNEYKKRPFTEYQVNDDYYLKQIYKVIDTIESENVITNNAKHQLTLF